MKYLILLLLPLSASAQDTVATRKLDELITAYQATGHFNGSALVARKGTVLLQKGYGVQNAGTKRPNDARSIYQIASVTKTFTSTVVLRLMEQGKISLQDKLEKYYPGFPNGDRITIEHLLTHTSGLHNFTETDTAIDQTDEKRFIPYLKTLKPDFAPDSNWHYSNTGYVLLGFIIQQVSGMSYWKAVRSIIFQPLGMTSSGFDMAHLTSPHRAIGYDILGDSTSRLAKITDSSVPFGAGAIYSTVEDMYKYHRGLQTDKMVGRQLIEQAYAPHSLHNYGYGWQIDSVFGRKMVSHSGSISGFGSNFARIPADDICIVLLSNKSGSTFDVMDMTRKLTAILYGQPYTLPKKRIPVELDSMLLKKYTGTYEIADMQLRIEMGMYDNHLVAQPERDGHPGPTSMLLAMDKTHFYDERDIDLEITIDLDDAGNITGMTILQQGQTRFAKKTK